MDNKTQTEIEISAILNEFTYLDMRFDEGTTLGEIVDKIGNTVNENGSRLVDEADFKVLKAAVDNNSYLADFKLVSQSGNKGELLTDQLIQAATFKSPEGDYYVCYRGTGEGRWPDNAKGMTAVSTQMQEAAADYFDSVADKFGFADAKADGSRIIVTGHSKGGNEAQYVNMAAENEHLIDNCYSFCGQSHSDAAMEKYQENKSTEYYNEQRDRMYSICGENDYVNPLGRKLIPDENTYYVKTEGIGAEEFHHISYMLGDGESYNALTWTHGPNGEIINGERGPVGDFAATLSERMFALGIDDLDGCATALMYTIDILLSASSGNIQSWHQIGDAEFDPTDFLDLLADGLPVIISALQFSFAEGFVESDTLKWKLICLLGFAIAGIGGNISEPINAFFKCLDFAQEKLEQIKEFTADIRAFFADLKEEYIKAFNSLKHQFDSYIFSAAYQYVADNNVIDVDTYRLQEYASRLTNISRRVATLDREMDDLYWKVGLSDILDLLKADLLTSYSFRLRSCANYLNETANNFTALESCLINKL